MYIHIHTSIKKYKQIFLSGYFMMINKMINKRFMMINKKSKNFDQWWILMIQTDNKTLVKSDWYLDSWRYIIFKKQKLMFNESIMLSERIL